jgi:hypothetical protein
MNHDHLPLAHCQSGPQRAIMWTVNLLARLGANAALVLPVQCLAYVLARAWVERDPRPWARVAAARLGAVWAGSARAMPLAQAAVFAALPEHAWVPAMNVAGLVWGVYLNLAIGRGGGAK